MAQRSIKLASLIIAIAFAWVGNATAADPSIQTASTISTLTYSPNNVVKTTSPTITIESNAYVGPVFIVFHQSSISPDPAAPAEGLSYGLYQPATTQTYQLSLKDPPKNANEVLSWTFTGEASKALGYAVVVSNSTLPVVATYKATIQATLYKGAYPDLSTPLGQPRSITLTVRVRSHLDVSVVNQGLGFSLNSRNKAISFPTISDNASKTIDIVVRTNGNYKLSLSSTKGNNLISTVDSSLLSYELMSNASLVAWNASGVAVLAPNGSPTYSAYNTSGRYALVFTIKYGALLPTEGRYSASIRVTVAAL